MYLWESVEEFDKEAIFENVRSPEDFQSKAKFFSKFNNIKLSIILKRINNCLEVVAATSSWSSDCPNKARVMYRMIEVMVCSPGARQFRWLEMKRKHTSFT